LNIPAPPRTPEEALPFIVVVFPEAEHVSLLMYAEALLIANVPDPCNTTCIEVAVTVVVLFRVKSPLPV